MRAAQRLEDWLNTFPINPVRPGDPPYQGPWYKEYAACLVVGALGLACLADMAFRGGTSLPPPAPPGQFEFTVAARDATGGYDLPAK